MFKLPILAVSTVNKIAALRQLQTSTQLHTLLVMNPIDNPINRLWTMFTTLFLMVIATKVFFFGGIDINIRHVYVYDVSAMYTPSYPSSGPIPSNKISSAADDFLKKYDGSTPSKSATPADSPVQPPRRPIPPEARKALLPYMK